MKLITILMSISIVAPHGFKNLLCPLSVHFFTLILFAEQASLLRWDLSSFVMGCMYSHDKTFGTDFDFIMNLYAKRLLHSQRYDELMSVMKKK